MARLGWKIADVDDAAWPDVTQLFNEWRENPPVDLLARWYTQYEPKALPGEAGDKFFGDDDLPAEQLERQAPSIAEAPPEVQQVLEHFLRTRGTHAA